MLSYVAHYKNKYPNGRVYASEDAIDVYCEGGLHRVALRKNGAGQWVDKSEVFGCADSHDLAPIPKDARQFKHYGDKIGPAEEHAERSAKAKDLKKEGKILSIKEYEQEGLKFDDKGALIK